MHYILHIWYNHLFPPKRGYQTWKNSIQEEIKINLRELHFKSRLNTPEFKEFPSFKVCVDSSEIVAKINTVKLKLIKRFSIT